MAHQLGISAKKAALATTECINESRKAVDLLPEESKEMKMSIKNVSDAVSKLESSTDYFFQNPTSEAAYPQLLESAEQFMEPSNRMLEQATSLLGHLTCSNVSFSLVNTSEEMEGAIKDLSMQVKESESMIALNAIQTATNHLNSSDASL